MTRRFFLDRHTILQLENIVGKENITASPEELLCYAYDGTGREHPPAVVAFPGSTQEISEIMRLATRVPFSVVPRGAGTGMTGGALPLTGGLVLAMARLNKILEIDRDNHIAVVEPGVITGQFQEEVKRQGLYYPPDPSSLKYCTIGGNVAECAGGPSAVKYGVTRDYVLGLEAVLPDGRIITTGVRTAKGVVGYDLTRLLVGSEGTLAIITKIILRLISCPVARTTFLVLSDSIAHATSLVSKTLGSYTPCTLEYMDRTALKIVAPLIPFRLPPKTEAMLLLELDGDEHTVAAEGEKLYNFLLEQDGVIVVSHAKNQDEVSALWSARRSISPASFNLKPDKMSEDVVVPRSCIPQLVAFTERLSKELGLTIFTFGHAGDGNIHVNIMLDKANPKELRQAAAAKKLLFEEVLRLSGTLSGEHGVGITKAEYLPLEVTKNSLDTMKDIKKLFDPKNILNPGKIFPP